METPHSCPPLSYVQTYRFGPAWNFNWESNMVIGDRLKALREHKNLSQGDIERSTGLLRSYISRVENGHTVPAIETLEKLARALDVPLYQIFYDGEEPPKPLNIPKEKEERLNWGAIGKDRRTLQHFRRLLGRTNVGDRNLLMFMAARMATRKKLKAKS